MSHNRRLFLKFAGSSVLLPGAGLLAGMGEKLAAFSESSSPIQLGLVTSPLGKGLTRRP